MSDDIIRTTVTSISTEVPGRTLNTARHNHFVIDSPSGPGEALSTGEAFLSGISACGVTLVQGVARDRQIDIGRLSVEISGVRLASNPIDFDHIDIAFVYDGPTMEQAEDLTAAWQAH